jgi:hypothetical protein
MMRLRRGSATIALCLLASAMTACAQCGWVLWEISSPTTKNPDRTYDKIDAEATNEACNPHETSDPFASVVGQSVGRHGSTGHRHDRTPEGGRSRFDTRRASRCLSREFSLES